MARFLMYMNPRGTVEYVCVDDIACVEEDAHPKNGDGELRQGAWSHITTKSGRGKVCLEAMGTPEQVLKGMIVERT